MKPQIHILNGDALKQQFPSGIRGEKIVMRECLVDGSVKGKNLKELYKTRAAFLHKYYGGCSKEEYEKKTVSEFQKIQGIDPANEINLWFEDDLFCQVNFWFVCWLITSSEKKNAVYLIRPDSHTQYGFGALNQHELISLFEKRTLLSEIPIFAKLWEYYRDNKREDLKQMALGWKSRFPFLVPAVQAHLDRMPKEKHMGRPKESLLQISWDLGTTEFGPVFREFCKQEPIYGFGDLQVRRLLEEVKVLLDKEKLYKGLLSKKYEAFDSEVNLERKKLLRAEVIQILRTEEDILDSEDIHIWGLTYYMSDDDKEHNKKLALEKFLEAFELDSRNFLACLYIAHCYHDQKDLEEALNFYKQVDREALREFQLWRYVKLIEQIGYCEYKLGRKEIGRMKFQEVLEWYKKSETEDLAIPSEMRACLPETDEIIQKMNSYLS